MYVSLSSALQEKLAIYGSFHGADHSSSAFNAELRAGASTLPLRHFTPTYCQECGTRLHGGETCPECGCSYQTAVECDGCGKWIEVNEDAFDTGYSGHDDGACDAVAYRCPCRAPNSADDFGRYYKCRRCGLRMYRCGSSGAMSVGTCDCGYCR